MPTIPDPIEVRLIKAYADFLATTSADPTLEACRAAIAALSYRVRDEDDVITPESDTTKGARHVVTVSDSGRAVRLAPTRNLRLELMIRANRHHVTPAAQNQLSGALGYLVDKSNLLTGLDSVTREIRVHLVTRVPGALHMVVGDIVTDSIILEVKATVAELTGNF